MDVVVANAVRAYRSDLGDFCRFFTGPIDQITAGVLRQYLGGLAGKAPGTVPKSGPRFISSVMCMPASWSTPEFHWRPSGAGSVTSTRKHCSGMPTNVTPPPTRNPHLATPQDHRTPEQLISRSFDRSPSVVGLGENIMNSDRNSGGIELADLISQVRSDLTAAMLSGQHPENQELLKFELGDVELELELVAEKAHKPGVKARLFVVDVGYDHERTKKSTNRIKLKMQPRLPSQPTKPPWITGQAEDGED